jgi:riboflavin synthase alpha subunit
VSLTVNDLPAPGILQVSLIDFTMRHTTLGTLTDGDDVHVEADMLGKYVRQFVTPYVRESGVGSREWNEPGAADSRFPISDSR